MRKPPKWGFDKGLVDPKWDWFWRACIFAVIPGNGWNRDLIEGAEGVLNTSANFSAANKFGPVMESTSSTTGGAEWYHGSKVEKLLSRDYTIFSFSDITSLAPFGNLFALPWEAGAWDAPFNRIAFSRSAETDKGNSQITNTSSNDRVATSGAGFFPLNEGPTLYAVSRRIGTGFFYKKGLLHSSGSFGTTLSIGFQERQPIAIFNRRLSDDAEGIVGTNSYTALLRDGISDAKHLMLAREPFGPFTYDDEVLAFVAAAAVDNFEWMHGKGQQQPVNMPVEIVGY